MDGIILFDNLPFFAHIKNEIYKDVLSNFKPKILKFAHKYGSEKFDKFCFFAFRKKYKDEKEKGLGKMWTTVTMCLNQDTPDAALEKFSTDFKKNYSEFVFKERQYMKVQNYRLSQNIEIQYYDPLAKIDLKDPEVPDFYTSFSKEGLVLNKDVNHDPLKVKFSFRYDQLVDCSPFEAASLKKILPEKLSSLYKPDDCCVSYLTDWSMKGIKNMFCSMYKTFVQCKSDIKIFSSTMYEYCIADKIENFNRVLKKLKNDLTKANFYFLELSGYINMLNEVIHKNLENYQNPESKLHADIVNLKKDAKRYKKILLKLFEKDVNKDPKGPKCSDILAGALDKKPEKGKGGSDFESVDRAQEKAEKTPGAQALNLIKKYKVKYCQDLKDLNINSDKPAKDEKPKKDEPKKDEPKKEKEEPNKKPDTIKEKLNDIKNMAIGFVNQCKTKEKFTPTEALKLTNTILKHHKTFEKVQKKKITLPKKLCKELKNKPEEGVRNVEKLANEKNNKFEFEKEVAPPIPDKKDGDPMKKDEEEVKKGEIKVNKLNKFFKNFILLKIY